VRDFYTNANLAIPEGELWTWENVLSGIIAGIVAQSFRLKDVAIFGVEVQARARDLVAKKQGEIGIIPQYILSVIP
jgi:NAD(P)H-hydrate repair Nnr-like enzyme with NAD(P)H-hydrate dehydratase domain